MKYFTLLSLPLLLNALTLSIESGSENSNNYSILHLKNSNPFECKDFFDEFFNTTKIECKFDAKAKQNIDPIKNQFFSIKRSSSENSYSLTITPSHKMKLYRTNRDLYDTKQVYGYNHIDSKHWMIMGYKDSLPVLKEAKQSYDALNLPIKIAGSNKPMVGSIDLKGNAVKLKASHDITDYLDMKKAYDRKDYHRVIATIDKTLDEHPETIFKNDMLLYLIRSNHALQEPEEVVEASKIYLKKYSSDNATPEILAYISDAYAKLGQSGDSEYCYNRLRDDYPNSEFVNKATLMRAGLYDLNGDKPKAAAYYDMVLKSTKDVDMASEAAFGLATLELGVNESQKARDYVNKILTANPSFFTKNHDKSIALATQFSDKKYPLTAAKITKIVLDDTDKKKYEYEELLKNLGLLYVRAKSNKDAVTYLDEYMESYKEGAFITDIIEAKDSLFFSNSDINSSKKLDSYDELISKYKNSDIGDKAVYNKAKLLYDQKKYNKVLQMQEQISSLDEAKYNKAKWYLQNSALELTKKEFDNNRCSSGYKYIDEFNLKLPKNYDEKLYDCAISLNRYSDSLKIANSYLKNKDTKIRSQWLSKIAKTHHKQGKYKEAIKAANDSLSLDNKSDASRALFDSARALNNSELMLKSIKMIEANFIADFKDIERYVQMVNLGIKKRDDILIQTYAKKVIDLQNRTKSYSQTPFIEFAYMDSLIMTSKYKEALSIANILASQKLSSDNRSRLYYIKGSIEQKQNNKNIAIKSFNESIKASKDSAWAKLAKDALELF